MRRSAPHVTLAYIGLGSNLGDREGHLRSALSELARVPDTRLVAQSALVETAAVGPPQAAYLNAAATLETGLGPRALLEHLLAIEGAHHRTRDAETRWGPRTLDLDLLLYGDLTLCEPGLTIPHPLMHTRRFVLEPLAQIAPLARIPTLGVTVEEALRALEAPVTESAR
jgi:2-amino-4-hydroxy-6-hydroxymethyldihydropteridine diphosphokinase